MENTDYYIKEKGKYKPVSKRDFTSFPVDGIWLVQYKPHVKSSECILKIGEIQEIDLNTYAALQSKKDEALAVFIKEREKGRNLNYCTEQAILTLLNKK